MAASTARERLRQRGGNEQVCRMMPHVRVGLEVLNHGIAYLAHRCFDRDADPLVARSTESAAPRM
jgi:hypothetical protein